MSPRTFLAAILLSAIPALALPPQPPGQPATGPGGADYAHASVRESHHGQDGGEYWLYEPVQPAPAAGTKVPLVIFLHGYSAMNPDPYRAWIDHLVRRGAIVIYPRYQANLLTPPAEYHPNAARAVRDALTVLAEPGHAAPDLDRVGVVGHSAGGMGAAAFAARAVSEKLPVPKVVMSVCPGQGASGRVQLIPLDDYAKIPAATRLLVVVGEDDKFVKDASAKRIWVRTAHVVDRAYVTVRTDTHGEPALYSSHFSPVANARWSIDCLDWYGYWRLFDALCADRFAAKKFTVDTGMGQWSDGTLVKPLLVEMGTGPKEDRTATTGGR